MITMKINGHFRLHPKLMIPKQATARAGASSNAAMSIKIEIKLLLIHSFYTPVEASSQNAIINSEQNPYIRQKMTQPRANLHL